MFHLPNWQEESTEKFRENLQASMDRSINEHDGWIIDGNYTSKIGDLVLQNADIVLYFNLPKRVVLYRVTKRSLKRSILREELWNGNRERFGNIFKTRAEENVILWALTTHTRRKTQLSQLANTANSNQLWIEVNHNTRFEEIHDQVQKHRALIQNI